MDTIQKLHWLLNAGITESISETPVNRLVSKPKTQSDIPQKETVFYQENSEHFNQTDNALKSAQQKAAQAQTIQQLYAFRAEFNDCPLKKTAAHTINGRGFVPPTVLCLFDTPNTDDERNNCLCSGESGLLLNKMLNAIGLDINSNTYISALVPWRPPGNRAPTPTEYALCRPFWEKEIALLTPKTILIFGNTTSSEVLGISGLAKARSTEHLFHDIPTFVTIAPSMLLKMPTQKKQAWEDLQKFKKKLDSL